MKPQSRLLFFLLIFGFALPLGAQKLDTLKANRLMLETATKKNFSQIDYQLRLNMARQAKDIFSAALGAKHRRVADAWFLMGTKANYLPNEHSRDYFYTAYSIYRDLFGENNADAILAKANYGILFGFSGETETCIKILSDCERLTLNNVSVPKITKGVIYINLAQFYDQADLKEYYAKKAIQLFNELNSWSNTVIGYLILGKLYFDEGDYENALESHSKALHLLDKNAPPDHQFSAIYYTMVASVFFKTNQLDTSLVCMKHAQDIITQKFGPINATLISLKAIEGEVWAKKGEDAKALNVWKEGLKIISAPGNRNFNSQNNSLYFTLAQYYLSKKQYSKALSWCDSVLINSHYNPTEPFEKMTDQRGTLKILSLKTEILAAQCRLDNHFAKCADFQKALEHITQRVQEIKRPDHKLQFNPAVLFEALLPSIESALDVAQQKSQNPATRLSQQFFYLQLAKAETLSNGFQANRLTQIAGVPETLLQREKDAKKKLADLKSKVAQAEATKDSLAQQKLYAEQFEEKKRFDHLQAQLQKQYPKLAAVRGTMPAPKLSDVRQRLLPDDKTALIEYFVGERSIYIFQITRSKAQSWKIAKPADFDDMVRSLHAIASDYVLLQRDPTLAKKRYVEAANRLSVLLLQKPLQQLPPFIQHLIIVPDANLHYVVFDALFTQPTKMQSVWSDFPYLLNKYAVSYGFSTGLLMEQYARTGKRPTQGFLGFAPQYKSSKLNSNDTLRLGQLALRVRNGEYELPGAQKEVATIAGLTGGRQVRDAEASEANFRRYAGDYAVLHLAMHAISDDRHPALSGLLFTPNPADTSFDNHLTLAEIYGLSLPAELAVLTACNSGAGKLRRGEGILSLGRAFTYAGVRSTVMSQWQAADLQTSRLMLLFYQELEKGLPKDVALQLAKKQYLATAQNPDLGHPFFWAGFVLNGNAEPLSLPNQNQWYWVVLALFSVLSIAWWRRRKGAEK